MEGYLKEWDFYRGQLTGEPRTIFVGGGTPSLVYLEPDFENLWNQFSAQNEWTFESNPQDVCNLERLPTVRAPRKRISLGVQSTRDDILDRLDRKCSRKKVFEALENFRKRFSGWELSVDLIIGIEDETRDVTKELAELLAFEPDHVSLYFLSLASTHKLSGLVANEDQAEREFFQIHQYLEDRNFAHYEVSNFSKPGKESQHNLAYWEGRPYVGLGPSSHSNIGNRRWSNVASIDGYWEMLGQGKLPLGMSEELDTKQLNLEKLYLTLRLRNWVKLPDVISARYKEFLDVNSRGEARCNLHGWMILDTLAAKISGDLDKIGAAPKFLL